MFLIKKNVSKNHLLFTRNKPHSSVYTWRYRETIADESSVQDSEARGQKSAQNISGALWPVGRESEAGTIWDILACHHVMLPSKGVSDCFLTSHNITVLPSKIQSCLTAKVARHQGSCLVGRGLKRQVVIQKCRCITMNRKLILNRN